jgi:hypothetical protein
MAHMETYGADEVDALMYCLEYLMRVDFPAEDLGRIVAAALTAAEKDNPGYAIMRDVLVPQLSKLIAPHVVVYDGEQFMKSLEEALKASPSFVQATAAAAAMPHVAAPAAAATAAASALAPADHTETDDATRARV